MLKFGDYVVADELHSGGMSMLYTARRGDSDDDRVFVVKTFDPGMLGGAISLPGFDFKRFLEGAERQRQAGQADGATHWAPIHEAGMAMGTAYYVTDHYQRSARSLIAGHAKLSSHDLYVIVRCIIAGLQQLRQTTGAGHGNLKPENVLLLGTTKIGQAVLTDPLPGEPDPDRDLDDLRAIGTLIFSLVLHRDFGGLRHLVASGPAEWSWLGKAGEQWRELCHRLLDPNLKAGDIDLAQLAADLDEKFGEGETERRPGQWRRAALAAAALAVVLAVVGLGALLAPRLPGLLSGPLSRPLWALRGPFSKTQWQAFCQAHESWVAAIRQLSEKQQQRWLADAQLSRVLEALQAPAATMTPGTLAGRPDASAAELGAKHPSAVLDSEGAARAADAMAALTAAEQLLNEWPAITVAEQLAGTWDARGWHLAAVALRQRAAAVRPHDAELGKTVDRLLDAVEETGRIEAGWRALEQSGKRLEASNDPLLKHWMSTVRKQLPDAIQPGNELPTLEKRLATAAAQGKALATFIEQHENDLDEELFRSDGRVYRELAGQSPLPAEIYQAWLEEAPRFLKQTGTERVHALQSQLAQADDAIRTGNAALKALQGRPADQWQDGLQACEEAQSAPATARNQLAAGWQGMSRQLSQDHRQRYEPRVQDALTALDQLLAAVGNQRQRFEAARDSAREAERLTAVSDRIGTLTDRGSAQWRDAVADWKTVLGLQRQLSTGGAALAPAGRAKVEALVARGQEHLAKLWGTLLAEVENKGRPALPAATGFLAGLEDVARPAAAQRRQWQQALQRVADQLPPDPGVYEAEMKAAQDRLREAREAVGRNASPQAAVTAGLAAVTAARKRRAPTEVTEPVRQDLLLLLLAFHLHPARVAGAAAAIHAAAAELTEGLDDAQVTEVLRDRLLPQLQPGPVATQLLPVKPTAAETATAADFAALAPADRIWYCFLPRRIVLRSTSGDPAVELSLVLVPPPEAGAAPFYIGEFETLKGPYSRFVKYLLAQAATDFPQLERIYTEEKDTLNVPVSRLREPVTGKSFSNVAAYSNWLSEQVGITTPAYREAAGAAWELNRGALGLRLPTPAQWLHAASYRPADDAPATDTFWDLPHSAGNLALADPGALKNRGIRSNCLGAYFMRGNVAELVLPAGRTDRGSQVVGGDVTTKPDAAWSPAPISEADASKQLRYIGFRLLLPLRFGEQTH